LANAIKQIVAGSKPLSTDVDQFRLLLSGLADFGALSLFQPIPNPSAPTATAAQISGVLNGAYQYIQVNVTGWVGSDGSFYVAGFAPSPASATVNPANQQVTVTLTTGPSGTIARLLYRTTAGGNTFKFLTWIGDNVTTTYTDNIADGNLGSGMPGPNSQPSVNGTAIPSTVPTQNTTGTTLNGFSGGSIGAGNPNLW
jgi:hypothetical protein